MPRLSRINTKPADYRRDTRNPPPIHSQRHVRKYGAKPDCEICDGIGYLYNEIDGVTIYNDLVLCQGSGCLQEQYNHYMLGTSYAETQGVYPVKEGQAEKTFANFKRTPGNNYKVEGGTVDIRGELERLAAGKTEYVFCLLYGGTGNGKSHLCSAFARAVLQRQAQCTMWDTTELLAKLRKGIDDKTIEQTMAECKNSYAFVLDDVKIDQLTDMKSGWAMDRIEEILSYRYQIQLVTLVTTNVDIEMFPERLISRFQDRHVSMMLLNKDYDHRGQNE